MDSCVPGSFDACPICCHPVGRDWERLGQSARYEEPIETWMCPRCTAAFTRDGALGSTRAQYRARAMFPESAALLWEDELGRIHPPGGDEHRDLLRDRLLDVRYAIAQLRGRSQPRLLEIGCRDGLLLSTAKRIFDDLQPEGIEPWGPWRSAARARGLAVDTTPIEERLGEQSFDIIVDVDVLPRLEDPVAHLRAVAAALGDGSVAIIGAPNLTGCRGELTHDILRADTPSLFTPRALATACMAAGLKPFHVTNGPEMRVLCTRGVPSTSVVAGPDVLRVSAALRGNDLRLSIKRALADKGPTPRLLVVAKSVHTRCPCPDTRADIAIEIAISAERCSDYETATAWLKTSLEDRADPDVEDTLGQLQVVIRQVNTLVATDAVALAS